MAPKIKVCGITNKPDALAAVEAGVDALGFMFYAPSKRFVAPETVCEIVKELPPFVSLVGVFVNESADRIKSIKDSCNLDVVQLHGDETPKDCQSIPGQAIKAFRLQSPQTLKTLEQYPTSAWLLDSYSPAARGGTGDAFNWDWVRDAGPFTRPIIIAGGLTPENAAACVRATTPYGLDVSSGVESSPGKKCATKMRAFVAAAKTTTSNDYSNAEHPNQMKGSN